MNIVLHEPEIPFNTGAIGRTCVATDTALHLIKPCGFELTDKYLKRAGMDYWSKLSLTEYASYEVFLQQNRENLSAAGKVGRKLWFATTKAEQTCSDRTITSCSEKSQPVSPRKYLLRTKMPASEFPCGEIFAL